MQERYAYSAYGTPAFLDSSFAVRSGSLFAWETLYAGYRYNALTGLFAVRNRMYHPLVGYWLTRDPAEADRANLFRYVGNRPLSYNDASGLQLEYEWGFDPSGRNPLLPQDPPWAATGSASSSPLHSYWASLPRCSPSRIALLSEGAQAQPPSVASAEAPRESTRPEQIRASTRQAVARYESCEAECYNRFQRDFWSRSWLQYRICIHECARLYRRYYRLPDTPPSPLVKASGAVIAAPAGTAGATARTLVGRTGVGACAVGVAGIIWLSRTPDVPPIALSRDTDIPATPRGGLDREDCLELNEECIGKQWKKECGRWVKMDCISCFLYCVANGEWPYFRCPL